MEYPGWFHIWTFLCCNHNVAFGKAFVVWRCVKIVQIIGVYWSVIFLALHSQKKRYKKQSLRWKSCHPRVSFCKKNIESVMCNELPLPLYCSQDHLHQKHHLEVIGYFLSCLWTKDWVLTDGVWIFIKNKVHPLFPNVGGVLLPSEHLYCLVSA